MSGYGRGLEIADRCPPGGRSKADSHVWVVATTGGSRVARAGLLDDDRCVHEGTLLTGRHTRNRAAILVR